MRPGPDRCDQAVHGRVEVRQLVALVDDRGLDRKLHLFARAPGATAPAGGAGGARRPAHRADVRALPRPYARLVPAPVAPRAGDLLAVRVARDGAAQGLEGDA